MTTGVFQFQNYEPMDPVTTQLGLVDTVCLPVITEGWYYYVEDVIISNLSNAARTFDIHLRPTGTAASDANKICNDVAINANTIYQLPIGPLTIPPGWVISGLASAASTVNVTLSGTIQIMPPEDVRMS